MSSPNSTTTFNVSDLVCGSAEAKELVEREDPTNFYFVLVVYFAGAVALWLLFGLWHGLNKCAYWKSIKAKYLFETRLQTGCKPWYLVSAPDRHDGRFNGAVCLLVWRFCIFVWFMVLALYWELNLYAFTNTTFTFTWIYFLYGTIISLRGVIGLKSSNPNWFTGDVDGPADWFGTIFAILYENVCVSVPFVDIVFWSVLANGLDINFPNAMYHGPINAIVIAIEVLITPTPSSWANIITSGSILQVYAIFWWCYYWSGYGCYPYPFQETNALVVGEERGFSARLWMIGIYVGLALVHLLMYGLDSIGNAAFRRCYERKMEKAHCCERQTRDSDYVLSSKSFSQA